MQGIRVSGIHKRGQRGKGESSRRTRTKRREGRQRLYYSFGNQKLRAIQARNVTKRSRDWKLFWHSIPGRQQRGLQKYSQYLRIQRLNSEELIKHYSTLSHYILRCGVEKGPLMRIESWSRREEKNTDAFSWRKWPQQHFHSMEKNGDHDEFTPTTGLQEEYYAKICQGWMRLCRGVVYLPGYMPECPIRCCGMFPLSKEFKKATCSCTPKRENYG